MWVQVIKMTDQGWTFEAKAWADDQEIYSRTLTTMFWSAPLADMGKEGWELVTASPENALMGSWVKGWESPTSRPVRMNFFFKRPRRP
jgi:hypothetical protein